MNIQIIVTNDEKMPDIIWGDENDSNGKYVAFDATEFFEKKKFDLLDKAVDEIKFKLKP